MDFVRALLKKRGVGVSSKSNPRILAVGGGLQKQQKRLQYFCTTARMPIVYLPSGWFGQNVVNVGVQLRGGNQDGKDAWVC